MLDDYLVTLETKVQNAVELIELLRIEIMELKEENESLKEEREAWKNRVLKVIERFDAIERESGSEAPAAPQQG